MGMGSSPYGRSSMLQSNNSVAFNPSSSDESEVPLTARTEAFGDAAYQQWDSNGRAIGHAGDPTLYMPEPRRAAPIRPFAEASTYRPQGQRQDSGASMGSAYQMSERGGYQSAPTRSDTMLTNPHPYGIAAASSSPTRPPFTASPPPMRTAYTASPPAIPPPVSAPAHLTPPQSPRTARPLQTAPTQSQNPYAIHSVPTPPPIPNPYADPYAAYAPSPPPSMPAGAQSAAYSMGSAPSSPAPHFTGGYPYGQPQGQVQMPGSAPLPPSYSHGFAQQQQQYPQTSAPQHGGYPTYESSTTPELR